MCSEFEGSDFTFLCFRCPSTLRMGRTSAPALMRRASGLGLRDRHKDQRKRIIKMCVQKLRDIDDPETVLCRAVLINNTFRTLKTAQRQLLRNARRRLERQESSEEEEVACEKEEPEEAVISPPASPPLLPETKDSFHDRELEELPSLGCDDSSMVHSLIMPPLLSPHIEDMTNCSFYDSFGPVDLAGPEARQEPSQFSGEDTLPANLKLAMMKSDLCDVINENNSNTSASGYGFPKSEFGTCGSPGGENGDTLLDNLLTEIAQA